ncbi:MAG: exo-alpha-sialidase [Bacteroidia bacterium]|nr:exo-alpha-sialidase [Bacteroidia bacterium]
MDTLVTKIALWVLLMPPILVHAQNKPSEIIIAKVIQSEFIFEKASFLSCHASTVIETNDGILTAWFGGTAESNPDVCIYSSVNRGRKWSSPELVADGIINDTLRYPCWNPVLYKRENGDIILYYKVGPNPREWWGMYKISKDGGNSWSAAVQIPDHLLGPIKNKPKELKNRTIIYPTSLETTQGWNVYVETSNQELSNWRKTKIDNNGFNAIQPTILFYESGNIQMLCRSREKRIVETWSNDQGKTWSPLQATNLPNNNSGIDAVSLDDDMQLLVCNPIEQGRNKLSLLASADGKNWQEIFVLEDQLKGEFSYPAIIRRKDGTIIISYTYNREKIKCVHLEILKKTDIVNL